MKLFAPISLAVFAASLLHLQAAETVQIDVSKLLNARVVATFTDGKVVPVAVALDGAGGIATQAVAKEMKKGSAETSVPDDGKFPATADHPEFVLHFSNADGTGNQVLRMQKEQEFSFDVPAKNYAKLYLFFTSGAAGPAPMKVTLTYQDGTTEERDITSPDWWNNLDEKNNPNKDIVYVAFNLAKWGSSNNVMEKDHHNIFALDVHPTAAKVLTSVKVKKTRPLVCFWGATGVTR